jgi:NTE family protein
MDDELISLPQMQSCILFAGLDEVSLLATRLHLSAVSLAGGQELFAQNEPADALFVVLSGALVVLRDGELVGRIGAGETVGEMALLSGRPRSARVLAIRDCELLRLSAESFEQLAISQPPVMLQLSRLAFQRLEASLQRRRFFNTPRTIAICGVSARADVLHFATQLQGALARFGHTPLLSAKDSASATTQFLHDLELRSRCIVLAADGHAPGWRALVQRQADLVLFVARADDLPKSSSHTADHHAWARTRLVLLHKDGVIRSGVAANWRAALNLSQHCHIRDDNDIARLARDIFGYGTAVVLSGGGARGFAHVGAIRAMRDAGLQVDAIGGTSIGAVIGAGIAAEWSDEELLQRYRRTFVETKPLNDYTLPLVSLVRGRKAGRLLREEFGDMAIEDLPLDFFCVSANLTRGTAHVHEHGKIWEALRASISIPGILPPVFARGEVLVDGGVMNNLPVDVMQKRFHGRIIGVDIAGDHAVRARVSEVDAPSAWTLLWDKLRGKPKRPGIIRILLRAGMVNSSMAGEHNRQHAALLLEPPVEAIDLLDWNAFEKAIQIGYDYTAKALEKLDFGPTTG